MQLIGDIHGQFQTYLGLIKSRIRSNSVQLGDHGWGFGPYSATYPDTRLAKTDNWFIRGNHDSPDECRQKANYLGDVGYRAPVFFISGGFSIDHELRKLRGWGWWQEEQLTAAQRDAAIELYCQVKPRFVISHDAPTAGLKHCLSR